MYAAEGCAPRADAGRRKVAKAGCLLASTLFLHLVVATVGFGGVAWTLPRRAGGEASLGRVLVGDGAGLKHKGVHVYDGCQSYHSASGTRKRVRITVAESAAAAADPDGSGQGRGTGDNGNINNVGSGAGRQGEGEDYYSILGLRYEASAADVKEAYRRLAAQVHPDANPSKGSRDKFESLTAAYEVLSDPGKRSTYDQGLAMRRFVDKVKAGNWARTLGAVANLGAVATTVGVSVGVAAAQPLAKDLARGLADAAAAGIQSAVAEPDAISRELQAALKSKAEAERKLMALKNKAADALAEAAANEEEKQARLKEMGDWNMTLAENQQETMKAHVVLEAKEASVAEANQVLTGKTTCEQAAIEAFRKSKAARQAFAQASMTSKRKMSSAKANVTAAEKRLAEALKALDNAREGLDLACKQNDELEDRRGQVFGEEESAEKALSAARALSVEAKSDLTLRQSELAGIQVELRARTRQKAQAEGKVKELGAAAEAAGARAFRLRKSAEECQDAAVREAQSLEAASREETRLKAEAAAAKAAKEAAVAAAREEEMQRERELAVAEAQAAVARARAAEAAAGAAAGAAVAAEEAAKKATAHAAAVTAEGERQRVQSTMATSVSPPIDLKIENTAAEKRGDGSSSREEPSVLEVAESPQGSQGPRLESMSNVTCEPEDITASEAVPAADIIGDLSTSADVMPPETTVSDIVEGPADLKVPGVTEVQAILETRPAQANFVDIGGGGGGREEKENKRAHTYSTASTDVSSIADATVMASNGDGAVAPATAAAAAAVALSPSVTPSIADTVSSTVATPAVSNDDDLAGQDTVEKRWQRPSRWSKRSVVPAAAGPVRRQEPATGILRFLPVESEEVRAEKADAAMK